MSKETVLDYVLVNGFLPSDLEKRVMVYAKEGYIPIGGPFVFADQLAQAMVSYGRKVDERPVISYGTGSPPPGDIPVR